MPEAINLRRRRLSGAAALALAAGRLGMIGTAQAQPAKTMPPEAAGGLWQAAARLPREGEFPGLGGANAWLNSEPLADGALRGKVLLINFCTYTCINWLRSLPYVRAWDGKYKDQNLQVIGVHTPEFPFERDLDNVRRAVLGMRIEYPVALDNDYAIWRAFHNSYWPALYFIDAQGRIRHHQFGEGGYEKSEKVIQLLLADAGADGIGHGQVSVDAQGVEAGADWRDLQSPENYVGYARTENFASPGGVAADSRRVYAFPERLRLNHWALAGDWTMERGRVVLNQANGRLAYRFHARDLHLVMGAGTGDTPIPFRVRIDGMPPLAAPGLDVDPDGKGKLTWPRLYQLVRQSPPIADRQFEIEFLSPGAAAYAFTFG